MNDDVDVVGIVEGRGGASIGVVVELPRRRRVMPNELVEVARVVAIAAQAALGGEVVLIPPTPFRLGREGLLVGFQIHDDVAADSDKCRHSIGPYGCDDIGVAGTPVESPRMADGILRASMKSMTSVASAAC